MVAAKTPGNQEKTPRNHDAELDAWLAGREDIARRIDDIELRLSGLEGLYAVTAARIEEIYAAIVPHKDALTRAAGMLDPSGAARGWMRKRGTQ